MTYIEAMEKALAAYRKFSQREYKKRGIDLSSEQLSLLCAIYRNKGVTQGMAAKIILKEPASVTRMTDILEKGGLVSRTVVSGDRRASALVLTAEGSGLAESVHELESEILKYGLRGVQAAALEKFGKICALISDNLA